MVIFGILVSISYILFNDTLQPSLANIFNDSIEEANYMDMNDFTEKYFHQNTLRTIKKESNTKYILSNMPDNPENNNFNENTHFGIGFGKVEEYLPNTKYVFSFDATLLDGELNSIGGHSSSLIQKKISINGKQLDVSKYFWSQGVPNNFEKGKKYKIYFEYITPDFLQEDSNETYGFSWIQPNRNNHYPTNFELEIANIKIYKKV